MSGLRVRCSLWVACAEEAASLLVSHTPVAPFSAAVMVYPAPPFCLCRRLCVWRLVRGILQRPPPIELRKSLGPGPLTVRGGYGDAVYNRSNPPVMPSHLSADCQAKWMNRTAFNALAGYCMELGLVQVGGGVSLGGAACCAVLCYHTVCCGRCELMCWGVAGVSHMHVCGAWHGWGAVAQGCKDFPLIAVDSKPRRCTLLPPTHAQPPQTAGVPAHDLALRLCTHLEQQELALLWALKSLAALLTGPQLEGAVVGLISPTERGQLEQLPVLMAQMGETLKRGEDRKMMWVFGALRNITVSEAGVLVVVCV